MTNSIDEHDLLTSRAAAEVDLGLGDSDVCDQEAVPPLTDAEVAAGSGGRLPQRSVAISISGGGYRAAAFGLGAVLAVSDMGKLDHTSAISSVSGGSITNAFVATQLTRRDETLTSQERWFRASILLRGLATFSVLEARKVIVYQLIFPLALLAMVIPLAIVTTQALDLSPWFGLLAAGPYAILLVQLPVAAYLKLNLMTVPRIERLISGDPQRGRSQNIPFRTVLKSQAYAYTMRAGRGMELLFQRRRSTLHRLDRVMSHVEPVFCTTDLSSGAHFYLAPSFVSGLAPGIGHTGQRTPIVGSVGDLTLAESVGASAAFPGVFQPVAVPSSALSLPVRTGEMPTVLALADGGLFDNLGSTVIQDWILGRCAPEAGMALGEPPREVIFVDCGKASYAEGRFRMLRAFSRSMDVVHQANSSARRLQAVGLLKLDQCCGFIVSIGDNPCEYFLTRSSQEEVSHGKETEEDRRAARLKEFVTDFQVQAAGDTSIFGFAWWRGVGQQSSASVPTTLAALGEETTFQLVLHGYMATVSKAVCELGWDPPVVPDAEVIRALIAAPPKAKDWLASRRRARRVRELGRLVKS